MLKKVLITILVILLIAVVGLFIFAFSISRNSGGEVTVTESIREIVSFGGSSDSVFERKLGDTFNTGLLGGTQSGEEDGVDVSLMRLRKIAAFPVASASVLENKQDETFVRFIARENGNIFDVSVDSTTQKRISNTTILRIWDALWLPGGEEFIARFLNDNDEKVENFYAGIKVKDEVNTDGNEGVNIEPEGSLEGSFLQDDITELTLSKSKEKIFYLTPSGSGSVGIISNPDGSKKVQVFDSPLSEWQIQWPEGDKVALTTKPSANIPGFLYFLNTNTGKLEKIISDMRGLTALVNEERTKVLFTHSESNRLLLSILDIKSGETTDLPIWTLSEKCIWSEQSGNIIYCGVPNTVPGSNSLDLWYQGLVSFSDSVWMIDTETQTANMLINPEDFAGESVDIIKPIVSSNGNYLFFINKKDSSLWQLRLEL